MTRRLLRDCRHEAAHAVIAEMLHPGSVVEAKIMGAKHGVVRFKRGTRMPGTHAILVYLAGSAAEQTWHRQSKRRVSTHDLKAAVSGRLAPWLIGPMLSATRELVAAWKRPIFDVARALKIRDLTGDEVRWFIRGGQEPKKPNQASRR